MNFPDNNSPDRDLKQSVPSKGTTLNPNAVAFVPSAFRSTASDSTSGTLNRHNVNEPFGKTVIDRSESSKSNNSDDEAHQFWHKQLPDDIIPDFSLMAQDEQDPGQLSLSDLSLDPVASSTFHGLAADMLSNGLQDQSLQDSEYVASNRVTGPSRSRFFGNNSNPDFLALSSANFGQESLPNTHFANGIDDNHFNSSYMFDYKDCASSEYATEDPFLSHINFLVSHFPSFSAKSLSDFYYANGCDLNLTIEILTQLELQVDDSIRLDGTYSTVPSFSMGDFPALPTTEVEDRLSRYGAENGQLIPNSHRSTVTSNGNADFVSAVRKLPSQSNDHWKAEKSNMLHGHSGPSRVSLTQYGNNVKPAAVSKSQTASSKAAPVWLETGEAVANLYSELRGDARDYARLRNACYEQATQAYLIGNKALAKELSAKGQLYNMQMKAAHDKAKEAIYRQRNSVASGLQGGYGECLIDLHGLHVNEALHILKQELSVLRSSARSTGEGKEVFICVGTGHHTKGSRTPRLPMAVENLLLVQGLSYTQPQPGLLRVVIY